jgi:transmembrane sensor
MLKFFNRFRNSGRIDNSDESILKLENSMESGARCVQMIDPETDGQWLRLKSTLEKKQSLSDDRLVVTRKLFFKPAFSIAIAAVILLVTGIVWMRSSLPKVYETAKGQHATVTLQDSTEVTLNYMSELKVNRSPFEKARYVVLKGEALFHVRRNGAPFIITTDVGTIQVLGTQFNVRVRDNKMEVAVLSGSVRVSVKRNGADSCIILTKGQIIVCNKNKYPEIPGLIPFSEYPGWTNGKFMFYKTNLLSACKEMELQFDAPIRIKAPQHDNLTITGIVDGRNIDAALSTLTQLTGNSYRYEAGSYIIY